jgi:hypothetical protein
LSSKKEFCEKQNRKKELVAAKIGDKKKIGSFASAALP